MAKNKQILIYTNIAFIVALFFSNLPVALAATSVSTADIEIAGWIPYWSIVAGAKDAETHIDALDILHPFGYSVKTDGTLSDLAKVDKKNSDLTARAAWQSLFSLARDKDVKIVPTVMWSSGADIEKILSSKSARKKHIKAITDLVKKEKFDGVNIDYEGKLVATKDDFPIFLKELKKALGKSKILTCAIEARTPPESLYRVVPENLEYANDYKQIGKYCDQVEIMTYDQGRADWKLNEAKSGTPYRPVADTDWVRKVAEFALEDIPKEKIVLGVATYGGEYEVSVSPNLFSAYKKVQSVNNPYALQVAEAYKITPLRNKAGELSFSYLPYNGTPERAALTAMLPKLTVPAGTQSGDVVAQKALAYANATGKSTKFNMLWWSDAQAIKDKIDLVSELGLKGIALFKIDGEADAAMWTVINQP
ncbi:MAG: glycosyl hydrolase family 18 protein [Candidatus Paceibacterota bacterium]|jgi:spore germination protein YaaH